MEVPEDVGVDDVEPSLLGLLDEVRPHLRHLEPASAQPDGDQREQMQREREREEEGTSGVLRG